MTEAAMAILQATPARQMSITVMNKALFYADLCALRDLGETITRSGYIALPQGPVLNHYKRSIVRDLERQGLAEQIADGWERPLIVRCEVEEFDLLNREEIGIAQLVSRSIRTKTAVWVSDYSHENDAWVSAFRKKTGSPINMLTAMQQVLEADPWLDQSDDPEFTKAITDSMNQSEDPF